MFAYQPNPISSPFFASPRTYGYPYQSYDYAPRVPSRYAYARALAEEERRERERLARQSRYFASPYDPYGEDYDKADVFVPIYGCGIDTRERAYLQAQKRHELERLRAVRTAEEEKRRQRAEEEVLQRFFNDSRSANDSAHRNSRSKSRTPPPSTRIPINVTTPSVSPIHSTPAESPRNSTSETREAAARTIQSFYRTQRALHAISHLRRELDSLVSDFSYPRKLDFLVDGQTISVDVPSTFNESIEDNCGEEIAMAPKLAYTPTNVPFRVYDDKLQKLLAKLDSISTELLTGEGRKRVRESRREVVRDTEREAARLEHWVKHVWESRHDGEKRLHADGEPSMDVEDANPTEAADNVGLDGDDEHDRMIPEYPTESERQDATFDNYDDMDEPQDLQTEDVQVGEDDDVTVVDTPCDPSEDVSSPTSGELKSIVPDSIQMCETDTDKVKQVEESMEEEFIVL